VSRVTVERTYQRLIREIKAGYKRAHSEIILASNRLLKTILWWVVFGKSLVVRGASGQRKEESP